MLALHQTTETQSGSARHRVRHQFGKAASTQNELMRDGWEQLPSPRGTGTDEYA